MVNVSRVIKKYFSLAFLSLMFFNVRAQNVPGGASHHVGPNGNSALGSSYVTQNVCGLNFVYGSVMVTTRYTTCPCTYTPGTGFPATIPISGLPACFTVQKAYLYWMASYQEATPPATTASFTNPALVTTTPAGTNIGQSVTDNWGEVGTVNYRADVTANISGNGNYKVSVNGMTNPNWEVDGVTLIIVYTTPSAAYSGSIVIYDGCNTDNVGTSLSLTLSGFTVCAATNTATGFGAYGDCQSNLNGNQNTDNFNGSIATFGNNFWNFNVIPTTLTNGQTTAVFQSYTNCCCDAWNWDIAGLYWQNTTCVACSITCALPINLEYFKCAPAPDNTAVNLTWATATETNNKQFEVQRSIDATDWQSIGTIAGAGNSSKELHYSYTDDNPVWGTAYYRIKQTDFDGNYTYSDVQIANITGSVAEIYPNPTSGNLTLTYYASNTEVINISVMDIAGKVVMSYTLQAVPGINTYTISTPEARGMYIAQIGNEQHKHYVKFVRQ